MSNRGPNNPQSRVVPSRGRPPANRRGTPSPRHATSTPQHVTPRRSPGLGGTRSPNNPHPGVVRGRGLQQTGRLGTPIPRRPRGTPRRVVKRIVRLASSLGGGDPEPLVRKPAKRSGQTGPRRPSAHPEAPDKPGHLGVISTPGVPFGPPAPKHDTTLHPPWSATVVGECTPPGAGGGTWRAVPVSALLAFPQYP